MSGSEDLSRNKFYHQCDPYINVFLVLLHATMHQIFSLWKFGFIYVNIQY